MKLRNKKTGEIIDLNKGSIKEVCFGSKIQLQATDRHNKPIWIYNSLAELNEEWEDYVEPAGWCVTMYGGISSITKDDYILIPDLKEIGNYFNDKESAYDALEKLKALKRLKDNGLAFCAWKITDDMCSVDVETTLDAETVRSQQKYITDDLNLLFGGEDESN